MHTEYREWMTVQTEAKEVSEEAIEDEGKEYFLSKAHYFTS
jgi:hypothetical protein